MTKKKIEEAYLSKGQVHSCVAIAAAPGTFFLNVVGILKYTQKLSGCKQNNA
jgi:hypothetical protein